MNEFFGKKINNTRVFPVTLKIIFVFTIFVLLSNLSSNYFNLSLNRKELTELMKQLLLKDIKSINEFYNTQYDIYEYTRDLDESKANIEDKGYQELKNDKAIVLAVKADGTVFAQSSSAKIKKYETFEDTKTLNKMMNKLKQTNEIAMDSEKAKENKEAGFIEFEFNDEDYFGVYRYNKKWDLFVLRAEELSDFNSKTRTIFVVISIIIILITLGSAIIGIYIVKHILRFIGIISKAIMRMSQSQQITLLDLKGAPNDDVTFLGVAFNSLANTIDNLITIFRKFVTKDIAMKAYKERQIRLEGAKQDLTILFSDIKSFTFITETLGTDIIKLLNMHYDRAIREIQDKNGIIGSIIGDAILAIFGTLEEAENKSFEAVMAAYQIQEVTQSLRDKMTQRKAEIEKRQGRLTKAEETVYKAVLLEIGAGIDGGEVFYGNIGSYVRMTNTVIGDNVNSASRLEGLTRIYKVPVICSEYIKLDIEKNVSNHKLKFVELDTVQVKGKTIGKKVYWPIKNEDYTAKLKKELTDFSAGLQLYYDGSWKKAYLHFKACKLDLARVFEERTKNKSCPRGWNGIWAMKTK